MDKTLRHRKPGDQSPAISLKEARAAKTALLAHLRGVHEVIGVGITRLDGRYAVKVNLREPIRGKVRVPAHINGVRVCVEVTGTIHARPRSRLSAKSADATMTMRGPVSR